ncbi:MAG TPA: hypothetical protein VMU42_00515 [Candidatus Sulfotelmatobacter sp.]|nr:hypothetical protein [Candidatus Sulfotelmatobacter sp.]
MSVAWVGSIAWESYSLAPAAVAGSHSFVLESLAAAVLLPLGAAALIVTGWLVGLYAEAVLMRFPWRPRRSPPRLVRVAHSSWRPRYPTGYGR